MYSTEYVRPESLADAIKALQLEGAAALAGGQTLIPTLKQRLASHETLVDIRQLAELQGITVQDGVVEIGAGTPHSQVARSKEVQQAIPALAALAGGIGDPQVRNLGTIGGSIANNDPAADYPAAVLGLAATVVTDKREVAAEEFFLGLFETALDSGELVIAVKFPVPEAAAYEKFDQPASRFALTGVFVAQLANEVRVAVTGAGENGVFRATDIEQALSSNFTADAPRGVDVATTDLIRDLHGTPEYRANLISVLTARAVASLA